MKRRCLLSEVEFQITESDFTFYKKLGVPPPTLSPAERARRRMAFSNQRHFFHRICDGSGKRIITNFIPQADYKVFDIEYWYSDDWDQQATGRDFDFERPFFDQFQELMRLAPMPNLQRNPWSDENSDYTNYAGKNKNCYLIFDSDKCRDCLYSYSINSCEDVVDCFRVENCELCYECIDCSNCYDSIFLQNCDSCANSAFLKNCIGCSNCFGCVNMKNKQYCFFNEQLTKEEFEKKKTALRLGNSRQLSKLAGEFTEYALQFPQRSMQGVQNEEILGDYLTHCKNAIYCFDSRKLWDCKYIIQAFDDAKNCMDCVEVGDGVELLYECAFVGYNAHFNRFTTHCLGSSADLTYCFYTPTCTNCFGCIGIHHAKYRILNKQYTKEEYEVLLPQIIKHMTKTGEWGEFFPARLSPFPYNLSLGQDFMPLSKEQAKKLGYGWREEEARDYQPGTYETPEEAKDIKEGILEEVLACERTGRNYKIQKSELLFYQKMNLPVPRYCFDERFSRRLQLRNPRELHKQTCDISGKEIYTSYAPGCQAQVVCEEEFAKLLI